MVRILTPKVHVEVFRPTYLAPRSDETGRKSTVKTNPRGLPVELEYIRVAAIENKRIKGIQFEETALFGGFIEINIAEDPQSTLFDNFLPNDHVEVFYADTEEATLTALPSFNVTDDFNYMNYNPKFQGATWKTDLKYRPTMVTTQLHAWDYLRLLQYINIPRGERKGQQATFIEQKMGVEGGAAPSLKIKKKRQKFGDDMLDYIDAAFDTFVEYRDEKSVYGQSTVNTEISYTNKTTQGLVFASTASKQYKPAVTLYTAGIGKHCHSRLRGNTTFYGKYPEVTTTKVVNLIEKFDIETDSDAVFEKEVNTWSFDGNHLLTDAQQIINKVTASIDSMSKYDILQFRFIDGKFLRFKGFDTSDDSPRFDAGEQYVADIVVITQFALIELLLKKLTTDHGLNQWFTPIIKLDAAFQNEIVTLGKTVGKGISKLIYVRLRKVIESDGKRIKEETEVAFNIDTYPFAAKFATDAIALASGNILSPTQTTVAQSGVELDIFSEILASLDFPQPTSSVPTTDPAVMKENHFGIQSLMQNAGRNGASQKKAFENFMKLFSNNFVPEENTIANSPASKLYEDISKRVRDYGTLIQKVLSKDDKIISYIKGVPASFMRADIYTGSKFNTIQYDSLAITRIIQLIVSNMAGFPATNNPISNTEKGKIDSYPIFAANRIVIKPRAYFGVQINKSQTQVDIYDLYPSLAHLANNKKSVAATCFLILEVAKKKLKGTDEPPEFEFPMEDIQDFGMVKAATVNHLFNFSIADQFKNVGLFVGVTKETEEKAVYDNVTENGIFIEYREGGLDTVGFSPPEHQHLRLSDLTQNAKYNSWSPRFVSNTNITSTDSNKPIYNPRTAYENKQKNDPTNPGVEDGHFIINNFDTFGFIPVVQSSDPSADGGRLYYDESSDLYEDNLYENTSPLHGVTGYVNISDLQAEYKTLELILTSDATYRDISNVDLELMKNIFIRAPIKFIVDLRDKDNDGNIIRYKDRILLTTPTSSKTYDEKSLHDTIIDLSAEIEQITETDMMWLFPYSGHKILETGALASPTLDGGYSIVDDIWRKHLFFITYLDLLVKGIRYLLWSMAKARFFAHIYLPIEYSKYAKRIPTSDPMSKMLRAAIVEPGSSVKIIIQSDNSLFTSVTSPLVKLPLIQGLDKNRFVPLIRSTSKGSKLITTKTRSGRQGKPFTTYTYEDAEVDREMTWYVSKKVTYLGADTGAMMRVEMTEGSLDWTLFYNEKNLLTQVSEHYLLNGLGQFRAGGMK